VLARYANLLGLNPDPACPAAVAHPRQWINSRFSGLCERAACSNLPILIGGMATLAPSADLIPVAVAEGQAGIQNYGQQLFARDLRGRLSWITTAAPIDSSAIIAFLERLLQTHPQGFVLLFKSVALSDYSDINAWLAANVDRVELVILPVESITPAEVMPVADKEPVAHPDTSVTPIKIQACHLSAHPDNQINSRTTMPLTHLQRLEAESMQIMREVVAETENPVMLYSIGKDSAVMLHLAMKAFYPSKLPFPLLHVDTAWKFRDMYNFRDKIVKEYGVELLTYTNPQGVSQGINPFTHGSALHTNIMKTEGLKQALNKYGFDAAFGGARRDEEKSRAKERIFSFRSAEHRWDPKDQRPELWKLYNSRKHPGESIRVFPISNWTELDIWQYIHLENIPIVPLYLSAERPVVERDGMLIMVDDERMPLKPGEVPMLKSVRFRTLGCYPLTGAVESTADTLPAIIQEMLLTKTSERQGRMIDHDSAASMEKKKQEGYF
jgi:sulfate adenylyltransferase subunit 2